MASARLQPSQSIRNIVGSMVSASSSPSDSNEDNLNYGVVITERSESHRQQPSTSHPRRGGSSSRMLVIIGLLLIYCMMLTVSLSMYRIDKYSLSLQPRMNGFESVWAKDNSTAKQQRLKQQQQQQQQQGNINSSLDENAVFEAIIRRVKWSVDRCNDTPNEERNTITKAFRPATDLPMLPEGGVASALERWLNDKSPRSTSSSDTYPTCYLPPPRSCHVTTYTLIVMSHTTERLEVFMEPLISMVNSWPGLTEVIIVWNSPRETLTNAIVINDENNDGKEKYYATMLLRWHEDDSHPLRIFFSLENGLANNLLNRYHPKLEPKNEAVMYFDDDGPFWSKESMVYAGLELWKRNSDVQVGGFPRNVRFLSVRMKGLEKNNLQQSIDIITRNSDSGHGDVIRPDFTPICRNVTGDHVEYNYFSFPDFAGHVLLPSGTILHRNYLCFIWHPAFEELRQWVIAHKTMPDDMTVSTLISHLSGRAPRTFPREVDADFSKPIPSQNDVIIGDELLDSPLPDQSHRRLLWKQKGWGSMREEAVNSILGYFGSIHPGTVGWCAGTPYMRNNNRGVPFVCHPEKPTLNLIPWLIEGGIGSTQCPLIDQSVLFTEKKNYTALEQDDFCGECSYKKLFSCRARMQYLIDNYKNTPAEAKAAVINEEENCDRTKNNAPTKK